MNTVRQSKVGKHIAAIIQNENDLELSEKR